MKPEWMEAAYRLWKLTVPDKYFSDKREDLYSFYCTMAMATMKSDNEFYKLACYRKERYQKAIKKLAEVKRGIQHKDN